MPVISQDDFLCPIPDVVFTAYPFHLVSRFQCFGHTLLLWKKEKIFCRPDINFSRYFFDKNSTVKRHVMI